MQIHHITPTLTNGDAVSNNLIAIANLFEQTGMNGYIFCESNHRTTNCNQSVKKFSELHKVISDEDIIIYHKSTGTKMTDEVSKLKNKVIVVYHNITPDTFFNGYNEGLIELTRWGREQLKKLKNCTYFICDSDYNKQELLENGIDDKKIITIPLLVEFDDFESESDDKIYKNMNDGKTNILFVGRVAPNKKQEDIIKSFNYYKKFLNTNSRLILVGNWSGLEKYYEELRNLVENLCLSDVHFCSHIPFSEIISYYKSADIFLCMSEHEGFCVPLLEAMYFELPIIAFNKAAVPETLNGSSILINQKDYALIAQTIDEVVNNSQLRDGIIENQKVRLKYFSKEKNEKILFEKILEVINN